MIRFIGRLQMEASPVSVLSKDCPASMPEMSLAVVPLLPTSRISAGAWRPWRPFPCTRISSGNSSMEMPIFRKQAMVERQSAPLKKLVILVVPREMAPSITARWEMDLSPGMVTSPFKASVFLNFMDGS